jgi:hypothetical protein
MNGSICDMKTTLIIAFLLVIWNLPMITTAQIDGFQSVSGDSARSLLKDFQAEKSMTAKEKEDSLWAWGGAPKGRIVVNGSLASDPYYIWRSLNFTKGWLGQAYIDPKTGYPVYAFIDPSTGLVQNFYVDPKTGSPIFINRYQSIEFPFYDYNPSSNPPSYSPGDFGLPAVFSSYDLWT